MLSLQKAMLKRFRLRNLCNQAVLYGFSTKPTKNSLEYRQSIKRIGKQIREAEEFREFKEQTEGISGDSAPQWVPLPKSATRILPILNIPAGFGLAGILTSEYLTKAYAQNLEIILDCISISNVTLAGVMFALQLFSSKYVHKAKIFPYFYYYFTFAAASSAMFLIHEMHIMAILPLFISLGALFTRNYFLAQKVPFAKNSMNLTFQYTFFAALGLVLVTITMISFRMYISTMEANIKSWNQQSREGTSTTAAIDRQDANINTK